MKQAPTILALAALSTALTGCGIAKAAEEQKDRLGNVRESVDLTVYKDDFGQVQELRPVSLQKGRTKLAIGNVSKELDPNSFMFSWPDATTDAQVVANVYDLGVGDGANLMSRFMGKEVEMVWYGQNGEEGAKERGVLEPAGNGGVALRTKDRLLVNPNGTVVAPADSGVVTMPQLSVDVESSTARNAKLSVAYLTRGLSWSADYVATLDPGSDALNLECWATITNRTGADFPNAKLTLVAGTPNRAVQTRRMRLLKAAKAWDGNYALSESAAASTPKEEVAPVAAGELYAYPVKDRATVAQEQMNRVRMLSAPKTGVRKDYSVRIPSASPWDWGYGNQPQRQNAQLTMTFFNLEKEGLGLPLPGGAVRVYEPDSTGALRYVGAATMFDTPKDGKVDLTLSNVFDVTAESKTVKAAKIDKKHTKRDYEVVLKNQKKGPVRLRIVQSMEGLWRIAGQSHPSVKTGAYENQWTVDVPAGGETTLKFSVVFGP